MTDKFHFTTPLVLSLAKMKAAVWVQILEASLSSCHLNLLPHLRWVAGQICDAVCGHISEHLLYSRDSVPCVDCHISF